MIEILSPATASYDCLEKSFKYQKAKVKEYWIVDPFTQKIYIRTLENDRYTDKVYAKTEVLESQILKGCNINLLNIFEDVEVEI